MQLPFYLRGDGRDIGDKKKSYSRAAGVTKLPISPYMTVL
jgi:hypothetical protein